MSDLDRTLAGIASAQHLLVTLGDVRAAGGTRRHATTRCQAGRWRSVDRGVFLINGASLDWVVRLHASVLAAGDGAVASHLAAARLYGMPGFAKALPELSIPRGRRYRRKGIRTHESTDLDRCDPRLVEGIPTTDPNRTLLDLARYVGDRRLARVIEWCRREGLVTWSSLISTLRRHARKGRGGVRRLRRVIVANAHREEITDSDFEYLVISLLIDHGLPEPVLHHRVYDGERFVGEVDLAYPDLLIAIECDSDLHRTEKAVYERDKPKRTDLNIVGWMVVEVSWEQFTSKPESVVRDVRAAREAAAAHT